MPRPANEFSAPRVDVEHATTGTASVGNLHGDRPEFRLVVTRGRLGIELAVPFDLGPLRVTDAVIALHGLSFPLDLSGGVAAFRHRRGLLERVGASLSAGPLMGFCAARLSAVFGERAPSCMLAPVEDGLLVGLAGASWALAFELHAVPRDEELWLLPTAARGIGLGEPPHAAAQRAVAACLRGVGTAKDGMVLVERLAEQLTRALFPRAGMRAPSARGLCVSGLSASVGKLVLAAERDGSPVALDERLVRALELAELGAEANAALARGALDEARRAYLRALERAPRHPELSRRLAEIDRTIGGRAEAAAGLYGDAVPLVHGGILGASLLEELGDHEAAYTAFVLASESEPYGALAALAWVEAGRIAREAGVGDPLAALDQAVARAPALAAARWERFAARLAAGDMRGAREDASQVEAIATGAEERHGAAVRAARAFVAAGAWAEASAAFERALRYLPDDADAVAGLARALEAAGDRRRALALLARAVSLASRTGRAAPPSTSLDLARSLAEVAGDLPAAVARARSVEPYCLETFEARLLEARWRAELGDLGGASGALSRLADAVERAVGVLTGARDDGPFAALARGAPRGPTRRDACVALATLLREGAAIEARQRGDLVAARRLVGLALRLCPHDRQLERELRRLAEGPKAPVDAAAESRAVPAAHGSTADGPPSDDAADTRGPIAVALALEGDEAIARDEAIVAELGERLRGNPADRTVALTLADALERLGRHHELLALASARVEEGGAEGRRDFGAHRRRSLEALAREAEERGSAADARLYRDMAAAADDGDR